jgi:hypothetical protein
MRALDLSRELADLRSTHLLISSSTNMYTRMDGDLHKSYKYSNLFIFSTFCIGK